MAEVYDNLEQYRAENQDNANSLGKVISEQLKGIAAFAALNIGVSAFKGIGASFGKGVLSGFRSSAIGKIKPVQKVDQAITKAVSSAYTKVNNFLSGSGGVISKQRATYDSWHRKQEILKARTFSDYKEKDFGMADISARLKAQREYYSKKWSSFFRNDGKFGSRVVGKLTKSVKPIASDLALFYTSELILDPSGSEKNPISSAIHNLPAAIGFRSLGSIGKGIANVGRNVTYNVLKDAHVDRFTDSIISGIQKVNKHGTAFYETLLQSAQRIKKTPVNLRHPVDTIKDFNTTFINNFKDFRKNYQESTKAFDIHQNIQIRDVEQMIINAKKIRETKSKKELEKILSQQYTEYNKKMDSGQIADAIGLNRRQTLNEAGRKQLDILKRRLQKRTDITFDKTKKYDELEHILQYTLAWERKNASKGVSLLDRGIYRSKSGKTIDTRGIRVTLRDDVSETDLINRIYNTANNLINIGPIKPLEIFQIGNLPGIRVKQSLGLKKPYTANLPNSNLTEYGQDIFNQQKELGVKQINRNIKPIINIDGHYYANKDAELVRITKSRMPVVLMPHSASIMKATLNEMINDKNLYAEQVSRNITANNGTATDHFLNNTLDLRNPFKNHDGILNRLFHPFRKFTSKRGPLQFEENYNKIANIIINNNPENYTPDELNLISDHFLSSMLNITNYARKRAANLFTNNKYVEKVFNIDKDIKTDRDLYRKIKELKATVDTTDNKELKTLFKDLKVNNLIENLNESNYKLLFSQKAHSLNFMESSTQRDNLKMVFGLSKMFQNQNIVIQTELADLIKSGKINTVDKNAIESYIQYIRGTAGFNGIGLKDNSFDIAQSLYRSLPKDTISQFQSLSKQFEHNFGKIKEYYYFDDWKTFENRKDPTRLLDKIPDEDFYNAIPGYRSRWEVFGRNITGRGFFGKLETKRVNEVVNEYTGLGLTTGKYDTWGGYVSALFTKRILPISGALYGLSFADNLIDAIPGIPKPSQVIQDTAVGARRIMAGIYDTVGLTSVAQYMEGLMPGSVDSPLGKMARTVGSVVGGNYLARSFGFSNIASTAIGYGLSALQGFGFMDLSKSREDIEDIYSGRKEIPIKAGRGWLFGFSNYEGDKIKYFSPSDYVINKSNARNDIYGGILERTLFKPLPILNMNPIGDIIDSGHYAKKLQYSYPVPQSSSIGTDLPLVGPLIGYLTNKLPFIGASNIREHEWKNPNIQTGLDDYGNGFSQYDREGRLKSGIYSRVASANSFGQSFDEMLYRSQEIIGLHGFAMNAMLEKIYGRRPFENDRLIENSSSITSSSRKFWETGGSDPFMLNEILRRLNPKPRNNRSVEIYNPLFNTKGDWLPEELQIGNILSKIERAEIRTPGRAYEALHTVNKSMPVTADYLGLTPDEAARQMLGLYKRDANRLRDRITAKENGLRASEGVLTYDPYLDIAGYYDKIVSVNSKRVLYKNINIDENYMGPSQQDLSQLNWLLGNTKSSYGVLTYSANGQVVRTENLQFNEELYNRDIERLNEARKIAKVGLDQGVGFSANTYSHIDRLRILGDVAPYSQEYKREKAIVSIQAKNDTRLQEQMEEIERKKKFASLPKELYPYRFVGRMFNPGEEQNEWNLNENIRPANSYSFGERLIGNIWEHFCFDENTIIITQNNKKKIKDIIENKDYVLGNDGKYHIVEKVIKRKFNKNTDILYKIQVNDNVGIIKVTGNHQVLAIKSKLCKHINKSNGLHIENRLEDKCNICRTNMKPSMIRVENLLPGDLLAIKIEKYNNINIIDLLIDNNEVVNINNYLYSKKRPKSCKNCIPRYIKQDKLKEFYSFIGWYLAEGNYTNKGIQFTLHIKEKDYANEILQLGKLLFNINGKLKINNKHNVRIITFNSIPLRSFFKIFNKKHNKYIPFNIIPNNKIYLAALIKSYILGDGYIQKDSITINTASNSLSQRIRHILANLNICSNYAEYKNGINKNKELKYHYTLHIRSINAEKLGEIINKKIYSGKKIYTNVFLNDEYIFHKIKHIAIIENTPEYVYDLSINTEHTYSLDYVTVHNSHANTIINTKFLNYRTPLEEYQRSYLYGSNMKPWQTPIKSFVEPWLENLRSQESVTGGAITAFTGSYLLSGSRVGIATMSSILGGAYGGLNEIYRGLTNTAYIPERVKEEREVNRLFDKIKYERGNFLYNLTGDTMYKKEAKNTLTYISQQGSKVFDGQIIASTYKQERPYMQYFLKETNSNNREDILRMVPEEIGDILTTQWEKNDNKQINDYLSKPKRNVFSKIDIPQTDWVGYDANVDLDDIKLAYINSKSMNNFNFGLGYLKQARKLERNPYINNIASELNERQNMQPSRLPQDSQSLKKSIDDLLNSYQIKGNVVVTNSNIDVLTIVNG